MSVASHPGSTACPTRYRTRHFFNNSNTNEDIATKFEREHAHCVRNEEKCVKEHDEVKRVAYCRWFQTLLKENPGILDYTWFSDEAWFHMSGYLSSQNSRICSSENPNAIHEEPLNSEKIGVWCGVSRRAHNWSHFLRRNHHNSCIYGNLQHRCKSIGR